jgi:pimeloyl-ACP methyl ester carboxylesterase
MFETNFPNYFYASDGTRIFYNTNFSLADLKKDRPVLVFVYGLLCSNFHFTYQIPFFEKLGYQILLHDYRFHFTTSSNGNLADCSFKNISNDLHELLTSLHITNGIFIGHSMGVNICLEHAIRYPDEVASLILISGAVVPPQDVMFDSNIVDLIFPTLQNLTQKYPKVFNTFWKTSYMNPLIQYIIFDGGFNKKKVDLKFIQHYMKKISELPEELFFHLLQIMRDHDIIGHLEEIHQPTLIIGGDKDKIIPNYLQRIFTQTLPRSEIYIVKDGSHVPQADFPELINSRIQRFIVKTGLYNESLS